MQIHELKPKHKNKGKKRIGRGGKKGTYSGKGQKGQSSRAGRKMVPIIRELIKKYPKLRGYRSFVLQDYKSVVNLETLEKASEDGDIINPENLIKKGIIHIIKGKKPEVKILGNGKLTKKLTIENCKISKSAKEAVEKAGGTVKT
ncbi:MAG: 50S ribosomal protein L15 [Candidatus Staskawiczbacteria bacterium RIFCSPLOWO2_01_FULL_37_25b]|uniref:Large ribosomal subunit protein uL15 n=2 Tax=Candidatus Staskawicziibacteriota TaxID=1817916 RepID=A0A1G2HT23_9BACT|nr:MAG: 50S ribosomal protein L15 [Candidatus Staskawiczbacteria bacterium RIFCSPHIGHO2_01_FULL_36_16]OGZ74131.1 MAG: 50S ribosomal protein L15 [Candidatus Staskawiczbacteria bacterium RIFCSPLOWO2_01_FULL_37_25b]